MDEDLDERAVAQLSNGLLRSIRDHYHVRPTSRDTVFEVLNALGVACAMVIAPIKDHGEKAEAEAREFLNTAIDTSLKEARLLAVEQADENPSSGGSIRAH